MKKIIIALFLSAAANIWANCSDTQVVSTTEEKLELTTDVPAYLKGATITVRLADGRESTVSAEQFKVVPRKQQFIVTKTENSTIKTCTVAGEQQRKNRISALVGKAPRGGLDRWQDGATMNVQSQYGMTFGAQYQRDTGLKVFKLPVSVGGQVQDNRAAFGTIGIDF